MGHSNVPQNDLANVCVKNTSQHTLYKYRCLIAFQQFEQFVHLIHPAGQLVVTTSKTPDLSENVFAHAYVKGALAQVIYGKRDNYIHNVLNKQFT